MSLIFIDGFDHWSTAAEGAKKWSTNSSSVTISSPTRFGSGRSLDLNSEVAKFFSDSSQLLSGVVGFAFYSPGDVSQNVTLIDFRADASSTQTQVLLDTVSGGQLRLLRGATVIGNSSTNVLQADTWYFIEWKFQIANSTAIANEVRVNAAEWINVAAGTDVQNRPAQEVKYLILNATNDHYDDFYILDFNGTKNNDFLGPSVRISTAIPTGNGNFNNFTGSDGDSVDNYLLVDETLPDTGTFVTSSVSGHIDTYNYDDAIGASDTVHAVQIVSYMQAENEQPVFMRNVTDISGTHRLHDVTVDSNQLPDSNYDFFITMLNDNPESGNWNVSNANETHFGVKLLL